MNGEGDARVTGDAPHQSEPAGEGLKWVLMVAHASFDVAAVAIIYWDLESRVAHTFFR